MLIRRSVLVAVASTALLCVWIPACAGSVVMRESTPSPDVNAADCPKLGLSFEVDSAVPERFDVPAAGEIESTRVLEWHKTLRNAFESSFGAHQAKAGIKAEAKLVITATNVEFLIAVGKGSIAQIAYTARVVDGDGKELAKVEDTVRSGAIKLPDGGPILVTQAVNAMYESMALKLAMSLAHR